MGVLAGNGNFLERVLGRMTVMASPLLGELRPLFSRLDHARDTSPLPESPPNEGEIRDWLLAVRRASFV